MCGNVFLGRPLRPKQALRRDTAMDTNIRQLIWNGAVPLEVHISDPENILNTQTGILNLPFYVINPK